MAALAPFSLVLFVVLWMLVVAFVARIGGWRALAERFEDAGSAEPERRHRFQSVVLRRLALMPARYRGSVPIGIGAAGLFLTPVLLFRFQHPPLFIPWNAIARCDEGSLLGLRWVAVEIRDAMPTLRFHGRMGEEVMAEWRRATSEGDR